MELKSFRYAKYAKLQSYTFSFQEVFFPFYSVTFLLHHKSLFLWIKVHPIMTKVHFFIAVLFPDLLLEVFFFHLCAIKTEFESIIIIAAEVSPT